MACACKVTQQINYLQKKYGTNMPKSNKKDFKLNVRLLLEKLFLSLLIIPILPFMLLHILFVAIFKKKKNIQIDRFFKRSIA